MSRYRTPNYIAKKSMWPAWDWWNILFFMIVIPAILVFMHVKFTDRCSWLIILALWAILPITCCFINKKLTWWNLIFFVILIPVLFVFLYLEYPEAGYSWLTALAVWCVIPFGIVIVKSIILSCKYIEFYDTYVIEKWGVFNRHTKKTVFPEVTAVTTQKNILGYGDVYIDVVGPWDVRFNDMARPDELREYLVNYMLNEAAVENISNNPYIAATDGIF